MSVNVLLCSLKIRSGLDLDVDYSTEGETAVTGKSVRNENTSLHFLLHLKENQKIKGTRGKRSKCAREKSK